MRDSTIRIKLSFKYDKPLFLPDGKIWYNGYSSDDTPTDEDSYHTESIQMNLEFLCSGVNMDGGLVKFYGIRDAIVGSGALRKLLYDAERACAPKRGPKAVFDWWSDDGNFYAEIDSADIISLNIDQALDARDEINRLRDRIAFLSQQLEDSEALWKQALEQRDDFQKKYNEARAKCLRIASERNKLRRESDNAVEFDDRR